jgi:unsaturated rhamnogalacturonyl hydrolase
MNPFGVLCMALALVPPGRGRASQVPTPNEWSREVRAVADLPGDPRIVSAAGITRAAVQLVTIENADSFKPGAARRLVIIGGFDSGDSAQTALDLVRWFKSRSAKAVRERWAVSVLPMADPHGRSRQQAFQFPPDKGFFDDQQQPESRYIWRWVAFQAPDLVVIVSSSGSDSPSVSSLAAALGDARAANLGAVPAVTLKASDAIAGLSKALDEHMGRSRLHEAIVSRATRDPLDIARTLAKRYPENPSVSYIPSLAWASTLRLAAITKDEALRTKVRQQVAPWLSGEKKLFGDRIQLTSVAGAMIYADLAKEGESAARALAEEGAVLAAHRQSNGISAYGGGWTDDMFMATSVLARTSALPDRAHDLDDAARMLIDYAARLQRPDGVFMHASDGPFAWGRGNGFAAFGLMEALTAMPEPHPSRARLLEIYRRHMSGLKAQQAPDGMWRQVLDEPGSYREETATAMILSAMARGIRLGWLDRSYTTAVERAWRALAAHVVEDGSLIDVCTSTGSGPTKRFYLDRAAINGPDDRGGAMALLASVEFYEMSRK